VREAAEAAITEEQLAFRETVVKFARTDLAGSETIARDLEGGFWREGWDACGRFGIQGLPVPEAEGGQGAGASREVEGQRARPARLLGRPGPGAAQLP